jgi:hypothetical protein
VFKIVGFNAAGHGRLTNGNTTLARWMSNVETQFG